MLKNDLRLFFASFFLTLLLSGWFAAFLFLDTESARYKNASGVHSFGVEQIGELEYTVSLLGRQYAMSLEQADAFQKWRKEYACLVMPRPLFAAEQLYSLAEYGLDELNLWYNNYQYQQNVMKSQTGVPVE